MPTYKLDFQTQINIPQQVVYEHLKDPQNFVGLQPLLTHVESVKYEEQHGKQSVSYDTVEAFRWMGIVLYRNRIHVQTIFTNPPYEFETIVHSFPNITLNAKYLFTPQNGETLIKETIQIQTHAWLAKFVLTQATQAQTTLLSNLKHRLENKIRLTG